MINGKVVAHHLLYKKKFVAHPHKQPLTRYEFSKWRHLIVRDNVGRVVILYKFTINSESFTTKTYKIDDDSGFRLKFIAMFQQQPLAGY